MAAVTPGTLSRHLSLRKAPEWSDPNKHELHAYVLAGLGPVGLQPTDLIRAVLTCGADDR
jgi:hypothetical protein